MKLKEKTENHLGMRLRAQREAVGMKVNQLAHHLGTSRNTITSYEAGHTEPGVSDLLKICRLLGCTLSDLVNDQVDGDLPKFAFRANRNIHGNPEFRATARRYLRAYQDIEEITGSRLSTSLETRPFDPNDGPPEKMIEAVAGECREKSGIGHSGPEKIAILLENLGVRTLFFDRHEGGFDGISVVENDFHMAMFHRRQKAVERVIFTAAHELAHLVLHPDIYTESANQFEEKGSSRNVEKEADLFAGYFLVPSDDLVEIWFGEHMGKMPLEHALLVLKRVFHVSYWCLYQRLLAEGLTRVKRPALIQKTKRLLGKPVSETCRMEDLEPEPMNACQLFESTRFERLVRSAFVSDLIGTSKVAEMFQVTVDEAWEITQKWIHPDVYVVE